MIEMSVDKETVCLPDSTDLPLLQHCSEPLRTCVKAPNGSAATRPSMDHPDPPIATPEQPSNMADSAKQTESTRLAKRSVAPPSQDRNGLQQASHQQPRPNKRRHSANSGSFKHPVPGKRRRGSRNWDCEPVLPTDFQLGGNIFDPLNLNSLLDEEVNRALNAQTPTSSPLPAKGGDPVEILIPRDITDPLNLNCCVPEDGGRGEVSLLSPLKGGGRRRHRNRHHGGGAGGGGGGGAAGIGGGGGGGRAGAEGGPPQPDISTSQPAEGTSSPSPSSALQSSHSGTVVDTFAPEDPKGGGGGRGAAAAAAAPPQGSSSSMNGRRDNARRSSQPSSSTPTPQATIPQKTPSTFSTRQRKWRRAPSKSESTGAPDGRPPPTALTQASAPPAGAAQPTNHRRHQHQPKATQHNQKQQQQKKFQYGNYNKYYGYRNPGLSEDPRIRVLKPQWFRGKTVLDLGCNSGHLTLTIARDWQPARIVGLDIDGGLIRIARQNIRHYLSTVQPLEATCGSSEGQGGEKDGREKDDASEVRRKENEKEQEQDGVKKEKEANHQQKMEMVEERRTGYRKEEEGEGESGGAREQLERGNVVEERLKNGEDGHTEEKRGSERLKEEEEKPCDVQGTLSFPVSLRIIRGPIAAPPLPDTHTLTHSPGNFPANVSFVTGNYVLERDLLLRTQREEYDVIMCLSVTKWVHLNWGDDGLKRLFQRVYRHLLPGGLFILEPQPWESYCRRKGLTDTTYKNYHSIRFKPDQFSSYLISEVGFSCYELIGTPLSSSRGFQRPIYVFRKGPSIPK